MTLFSNTALNDVNSARKLKYLRFTFIICLTVIVLFTLRYNLEYGIHFLNWLLVPTIGIILISAFSYNKTKNFYLASSLTVIPTAISLLVLVWTAGGLDAPGCIWLTAIPLTLAVLLGSAESLLGFAVISVFIIASYLCKKSGHQINLIKYHSDFEFERTFNFILFAIYSAFTSILYVRTEAFSQKKLNSQKEEIDSLLKILIHDIGTPLSVMGLTLSTLSTENEASFDKTKNVLSRSIDNIRVLLNQVKTMQAVKDGKAVVLLSATNVKDVIENVVLELKPRFEQKNLDVKINFRHQNKLILADPTILQYVVLTNLLTNAIKFSSIKGVIEINTSSSENRVAIEVRDYGIGMPEDLQKKLSKPFEATTRNGTAGERGTGYGLPLVFDFVKKLNGELNLQSSEVDINSFKKGTAFVIWFNYLKS